MNKITKIYKNYIIELYNDNHIIIRKTDKSPVNVSWYEMQFIKNIVIGPDEYAIEIYPSEDDLVDNANIRHLWKVDKKNIPNLRP
jgi:hypothetical protein